MKIILALSIMLFFALPAAGQTYTTEEFVVEGDSAQPAAACQPEYTQTVVTTTAPAAVVPAEEPVYIGMSKYHVMEVMGHPTCVQKFRKIRSRQQGIYDEVWTYQQPAGVTYVYIKDRRVMKVQYR